MILGLKGGLGSGKGTASKMMATYLKEKGYKPYYRIFAGKLKEVTSVLTGIPLTHETDNDFEDGIKDYTQEQKNIYIEEFGMTLGQMLQKIGTEVFRDNFDIDTWIKAIFREFDAIEDDKVVWIVSDTRFINEVESIKDRGGLVFNIDGEGGKGNENSQRDLNHRSETSLDDYDDYDYTIENKAGLDEFQANVLECIKTYF